MGRGRETQYARKTIGKNINTQQRKKMGAGLLCGANRRKFYYHRRERLEGIDREKVD